MCTLQVCLISDEICMRLGMFTFVHPEHAIPLSIWIFYICIFFNNWEGRFCLKAKKTEKQ